jgi:protein-S-isoprenylcysteine O-methyltransferase Ste14
MLIWARPRAPMFAAGLLLAAAGEAVRIWAAGTIHKSRKVTVSGPYAWVRHPLYVGSFLIMTGYSLMCGRWEALAIGVPLFVLLHGAAVVVEEKMLLVLFGEAYAEYSGRVPRLIPRPPSPGQAPAGSSRSFSWRRVLYNREPFNVACVVVLSLLFALRLMLHR